MSDIKSFTQEPVESAPKRFEIDEEVYECIGTLSANAELVIAQISDGTWQRQALGVIEFLRAVLLDESLERFEKRLRDKVNPLVTEQLTAIFAWLLEEYSGRPTQRSPQSANGHDATGSPSTAGASA